MFSPYTLYDQKFIGVRTKDPFPAVNLCSGKSMELFRKSICWHGKLLDLIPGLQVIEQPVHSDHTPHDGTEYCFLSRDSGLQKLTYMDA